MMEDCEDYNEGLISQDWDIVAEKRKKDGYREGVSVGREAKVQEGFNKGFEDGLDGSVPIGFMCGVLSGVQVLSRSLRIPDLSESNIHDINDILQRLQHLKDTELDDKSKFTLQLSETSSVTLEESLKNEGQDTTIGEKATNSLETQSDGLGADTHSQGDEEFCEAQKGEANQSSGDGNLSHQILQDYYRLLKDLDLGELIPSVTSVRSCSI